MKTKMLINACAILIFIVLPSCQYQGNDQSIRPNLLFILAEDMQAFDSSDSVLLTPNLDKLKAKGVYFPNAYCNSPMCLPSRTSMLTGIHPKNTMLLENNIDWIKYAPNVPTLPKHLKDNGYTTTRVGKIAHLHGNENIGWDQILNYSSTTTNETDAYLNSPKIEVPNAIKDISDKGLYPYLKASLKWGSSGIKLENEQDYRMAKSAEQYLKGEHDKPFFLAVGFSKVHLPITAPKHFLDLYKGVDIQLPRNPENDLEDIPNAAYWDFQSIDHQRISQNEWKDIRKAYYASISFMDHCVGIILDALETNNLLDNTIIIFTADHGLLLGEHFLWRKEVLFEEALKVPFLINVPQLKNSHGKRNQIIDLLDIYPTITDLCSIPEPEHLEGKTIVPILKDSLIVGKECSIALVKQGDTNNETIGYSIRTNEWRYTEWSMQPELSELYNHNDDPYEYKNMSNTKICDSIKIELRKKMYYQR